MSKDETTVLTSASLKNLPPWHSLPFPIISHLSVTPNDPFYSKQGTEEWSVTNSTIPSSTCRALAWRKPGWKCQLPLPSHKGSWFSLMWCIGALLYSLVSM